MFVELTCSDGRTVWINPLCAASINAEDTQSSWNESTQSILRLTSGESFEISLSPQELVDKFTEAVGG